MKLHPRVTRALIDLVIRFETFQGEAEPADGGGFSIGYGHTLTARAGAVVTREEAALLLRYDLARAADAVETALYAPVSQRQFEALTAFCFNVGPDNFRRSSALARVNAGAELDAADEIERWRRAELGAGAQVVDALVRRRAAEKAHFLGLPEGFAKSPSARLRPLAADGGEIELDPALPAPPPTEASLPPEATSSAVLDAAAGVQARLRRLFPEAGADVPPTTPGGVVAEPKPAEPEPSQTEPHSPFALQSAGPIPAEPLAGVVSPTVSATYAERDEAPRPPPSTFVPPPPPASVPHPGGGLPGPTPGPPMAPGRQGRRILDLALVAVGAVLFAAAVVLILGAQPSATTLGAGMFGALLAALGAYRLLGPADGVGRDTRA